MRKLTASVLCLLILVLAALSGCGAGGGNTTTTAPPAEPVHQKQEGEPGEPLLLSDRKDGSRCDVFYPAVGIAWLDAGVKTLAQGLVSAFNKRAGAGNTAKDPAVMTGDYTLYLACETGPPPAALDKSDYLSVVFETETVIPSQNLRLREVRAAVFDTATGERLENADLFRAGYPKRAAQLVSAYFKADKTTAKYAATQDFKKYTSAAEGDFTNVAFSGDKILFFFDAGTVLPASAGCPRAETPVKRLGGYLKAKIASYGIADGEKLIALTFDDGPRKNTPAVLGLLKKYGARATFFTIGNLVETHKETVKTAAAQGCEIANHSYSHRDLTKIKSIPAMKSEAEKPNKLIMQLTGQTRVLFRAPFAFYNNKVLENVDMPFIFWNVDPKDWAYKSAAKPASVQKIVNNVVNVAGDGDIVVMHDIYANTSDALAKIIPAMQKKGYRFVTVSEMFEARGIELENGKKYYSAH